MDEKNICTSNGIHGLLAVFKKDGILTQATAWMNLKNTALSEISHIKENAPGVRFCEEPGIGRFTGTESRLWSPGAEGGRSDRIFIVCRASVFQDQKVMEISTSADLLLFHK